VPQTIREERPIREESTLTAKGQTTVPKIVRQVLGIETGDRIAFKISDGRVTVEKVIGDHEDPALGPFLSFLAKDLRPERVVPLTPALLERISELTKGVKVDPDAPIDGDVDL